MKKLYAKNELTFSIIWIVLYVILLSTADSISADLGIEKLITAPLCVVMTAFLFFWVKKNDLMEKYGLCKFKGDLKKYLFFLPLVVLCSTNLWNGVTLNISPLESLLYVISMFCVGFLEELIFRGFLFRALCRDSVKTAVWVSSVTFGIGHIVNLLNGAALLPTLLQLCYATAAGFLFTVMVYLWGSLWPCIVTHSLLNSLSAVAALKSQTLQLITAVVLTAVALAYALWIWKQPE